MLGSVRKWSNRKLLITHDVTGIYCRIESYCFIPETKWNLGPTSKHIQDFPVNMVHCEAVPTGINWFDENKWGSHFLRWPTLLSTVWVISQGCLRRRGDDSTLAFPPHMQDKLMIDGVKPKHIYIHTQVCVYSMYIQIILCTYNKCIYIYVFIIYASYTWYMSYRSQAFQTPMWPTSRFCKWSCKSGQGSLRCMITESAMIILDI